MENKWKVGGILGVQHTGNVDDDKITGRIGGILFGVYKPGILSKARLYKRQNWRRFIGRDVDGTLSSDSLSAESVAIDGNVSWKGTMPYMATQRP